MTSKEGAVDKSINDGKGKESGDRKSAPYQGNRYSNQNHNQNNNNQNNNKNFVPRQFKFEGECPELKGSVYDCIDSRQADMYSKTNKVLAGYVGRTYKYSGDIRLVVEKLVMPDLEIPVDPPADASLTAIKIWDKEVDEYMKLRTALRENVKTLYSLVWGQCSDNMRQRVEASPNFATMSSTLNGLTLLISIKSVAFQFQSQNYPEEALHEAKRRFFYCRQKPGVTVTTYLELFQSIVDVIDHVEGDIGTDRGLINRMATSEQVDLDLDADHVVTALKSRVKDKYLATAFILGADRVRFGKLIEDMQNGYLHGRNDYPVTLTAAYNLLINWKQDSRNGSRNPGPNTVLISIPTEPRREPP
jgi:hypothetical protein